MSREEKSDEVKDRLAGRFDNTADEEEEQPDKSDNQENTDKLASQDTTDNLDDVDNTDNLTIDPKEDWTGRMVYVPGGEAGTEDLLDTFDGEYDRFQYECDWDIRKQLHYYPVLVTHGILELEEMDEDEFTEAVDELGLRSR